LVGSNIKIGIYKTNLAIEIAKKTRTWFSWNFFI
jgi:hypothetical protein